jgi:hypothetical protein
VPLCPPQIPHDLIWAWTRVATVGSQQLTAWTTAGSHSSSRVSLKVCVDRIVICYISIRINCNQISEGLLYRVAINGTWLTPMVFGNAFWVHYGKLFHVDWHQTPSIYCITVSKFDYRNNPIMKRKLAIRVFKLFL